ncbi:hypothetical protein HDV02_002020 [Globomyces sp. JEL0801]|nr:hypothetical protein HDV02_002020 [Globomyces sp. JEL0801]
MIDKSRDTWSWVSIGFGSQMLNSHVILCQSKRNDGTAQLLELQPSGKYSAPIEYPKGSKSTIVKSNAMEDESTLLCTFSRNLDVDDNLRPDIGISQNIIWAFNPSSSSSKLTIHNFDGAVQINLESGNIQRKPTESFDSKLIHGYLMIGAWMILVPLGIFVARFGTHLTGWILIKVTIQLLANLLIWSSGIFALLNYLLKPILHMYLGLAILALIFVQSVVGIFNYLGFSKAAFAKHKKMVKLGHQVVGYSVLVLAFVQIAVGIDTIYPITETKTFGLWIIYFSLLVFWIGLFSFAEVYFRLKISIKDTGYSEISSNIPLDVARDSRFGKYTWDSINDLIKTGESDFDAEQFTTGIEHSAKSSKKSAIVKGVQSNQFSFAEMSREISVTSQVLSTINGNNYISSSMTKSDVLAIQQSRRNNVHSRNAIKKLSGYAIGKLENGQSSSSTVDETSHFNPNQYRRYALTKMEILSQPQEPKLVLLMKFCLMYPNNNHNDQPNQFLPGQCMEIQIRLESGEIVERYLTPINGNLTAFELMIRVQHNGKLTEYLKEQKVGSRQFKFRGPFGTPFFGIPNQLGFTKLPETVYFISGGTGITPCLQILNSLFLTTNYPLQVIQDYNSKAKDEISLRFGDFVSITHHYYDGWCYGKNLNSKEEGLFPVGCTRPFGVIKLVIVNIGRSERSMLGYNRIKAAGIAFPTLVDLHSLTQGEFNSQRLSTIIDYRSRNSKKIFVCGPAAMTARVIDALEEIGRLSEHCTVLGTTSYN